MIRFRLPWLLAGCALQALAAAAAPAEALTAHLREIQVLHAEFTQTRTLAALTRPLRSTGSLVLARDQGAIWQIRRPLALTYVITPLGIAEVGPDGRPERKAAGDAPVAARLGQILQSVIQGRWSALDDYFTVQAEGRSEKWKIVLAPKAQAAPFLKRIQVSGGRFIERVRLDEPGGDSMDLVFEHPRVQDPLTEAESRLLAEQ